MIIFESGTDQIEVRLQGEKVWLSQEQMTLLFGRERSVITKHLRNVLTKANRSKIHYVQNLHILLLIEQLIRYREDGRFYILTTRVGSIAW